jgi:hypothetical protein
MNDHAFPALKEMLEMVGTILVPALIDFAIKAIPPIMELLSFMVDNWKIILEVLLGFKALGLIGDIAIKGGGLVLGGATLLKLLGGAAGGTLAGGGLLKLLGLGGATAAAGGTTALPAEIQALVNSLNKAFAPASAGAGTTAGSIATGVAGGALTFIGGAWLIELIKQEITGEKGLIITTIEKWGEELRTAWAGSWFEKSIDDVFGETGAIQKANTWFGDTMTGFTDWLNGLFGESEPTSGGKLKSSTPAKGPNLFDRLFGESGTLSSEAISTWVSKTFGEESEFQTSISTNWFSLFGSSGSLVTTFNSVFGEKGTLSGESISKWITTTFGEKSTFRTNIDSAWSSVFGKEGSVTTVFNSLFGEKGYLTPGAVSNWLTNTFGEKSSFRIGISEKWNSVFGKDGFLSTSYNSLFGEKGFLTKESISTWLTNTFGEKSTFRTKAISLWDGIFGKEGAFKNIFSNLFGANGVFSGTNITTSLNNIFGSKGTLATTITSAFSGIDLNPFRNAGKNIVQGIGWGIGQEEWPLYYQVTNLAKNITTWFNNALGIHSKSKVFELSGFNIGLGLSEGILSSIPLIQSAMSSMISVPLSSSIVNNDNRIYVEMNPSYANYASESNVYYDTVAAIASARR